YHWGIALSLLHRKRSAHPTRRTFTETGHGLNPNSWLKEGHPKCCQAKGSKDEEKLVHLKMVVKFEVLIEKKKMCSPGLMRFDWWMWFFDEAPLEAVGDEEVVVGEVWVGDILLRLRMLTK
ncbi:hypothetical protein Tco_1318503, partial [Tanacetum coccineum]